MIHSYEEHAFAELELWQKKMLKKPSFFNNVSKKNSDKDQ